jgi:hypothetical protein
LPKETNFLIKFCPGKICEYESHAKKEANMPAAARTSSEELEGRWASREAPAFVDFFARVELRVATTFLIGALGALGDFTARSASYEDGSSIAG